MSNAELDKLCEWFKSNRLSLNIKKITMLYFPRNLNVDSIYHSNRWKTIERVEHARFLGVYIDEKLQWNEHINQISAKVSKNIGILKKISHVLSTSVLLTCYNCIILWFCPI